MFLAKLTDLHYKLQGLTVLYVPKVIMSVPVEVATEDKEFIKRMEGVVVYWTKQVKKLPRNSRNCTFACLGACGASRSGAEHC